MEQAAVKLMQELANLEADDYDDKLMGGFQSPEEEQVWRRSILQNIKFSKGSYCLDVAAGTGVLTQLLAGWVGPSGHVVATDLADKTLSKNEEILSRSPALHKRVSLIPGDIHDPKLVDSFPYKRFDYITCRYGVHPLADPILAFKNWYEWLENEGRVVIIDAWWTREHWYDRWQQLADLIPLSSIQSLATVPYLLKQAGFVIERSQLLTRINNFYKLTESPLAPRYIVIARKP